MILSDSGKWVTLLRFEWEWGFLISAWPMQSILLSEEGKVGIDIEIVHLRPAHVASIHTQSVLLNSEIRVFRALLNNLTC